MLAAVQPGGEWIRLAANERRSVSALKQIIIKLCHCGSEEGNRTVRQEAVDSTRRDVRVGTEQIPAVAFQVEKHGEFAVRLNLRPRDKADSGRDHSLVRHFEVFHPQKQTDAARKLLPDHSNLVFAIGAGKEDACPASGRPDDDPTFRTPIIRQRRCVLHQLELKHVDEKPNSRLVVPHKQCR